jgi:hypothetical protein
MHTLVFVSAEFYVHVSLLISLFITIRVLILHSSQPQIWYLSNQPHKIQRMQLPLQAMPMSLPPSDNSTKDLLRRKGSGDHRTQEEEEEAV